MLILNSFTIRQSAFLSVVLQNDFLLLRNHFLFGCLLFSKEDRLGVNIFESTIESLKRLFVISLLIWFFLILFHPKNGSQKIVFSFESALDNRYSSFAM